MYMLIRDWFNRYYYGGKIWHMEFDLVDFEFHQSLTFVHEALAHILDLHQIKICQICRPTKLKHHQNKTPPYTVVVVVVSLLDLEIHC